jgi:hypothetical protein
MNPEFNFTVFELTDAINLIPNQYSKFQKLGLFKDKPIKETFATIDIKNNVLNVLPASERGGPGSKNKSGKRQLVTIQIPHFQHEDIVLPDEIQNVRAWGTSDQMETVQDRVLDKLATMKAKHDVTLEYMLAGAFKGQIFDGDGDLLLDLFATFGITQQSIDFKFGAAKPDMGIATRNVSRYMEKNLKGETMTRVHAICSPLFFDALLADASMVAAYNNYQGLNPLRDDVARGFPFQGVFYEEYVGQVTLPKGDLIDLVTSKEAIAFPEGTQNAFINVIAPADFNEAVNTLGQPIYAKQKNVDFDRGIEIHTQSNRMPIATRPDLLVRLYSSNNSPVWAA